MEKIKEYKSAEVTVVWRPALCMHSEKCWRGLPEVFKPKEKPWIQPEGVDQERLTQQIDRCPSGALSYRKEGVNKEQSESLVIKVSKDGPLLIRDTVFVEFPDGTREKREKAVALCRCGASANKPYCDGSHRKVNFKA